MLPLTRPRRHSQISTVEILDRDLSSKFDNEALGSPFLMAGSPQRISGVNRPCILLIVLAAMERFAFKGVQSNMVTYLTDVMKMSNSSAAKMVNSWYGFTAILPLFVAPLADSCWDGYATIQTAACVYALGLLLLTSSALEWPLAFLNMNKAGSFSFLSWSLFMVSLGQGAYNPSLQAFGADQLEDDEELPTSKNDHTSTRRRLFFQWWYFGICCGSLLGISFMSYIQDTFGWGVGFAIPAIALVTSIAIFTFGQRLYRKKHTPNADRKSLVNRIQAIKATITRMIKLNGTANKVELELQGRPDDTEDHEKLTGSDDNSQKSSYVLQIAEVVLPMLPLWTMLLTFAVIFQQPATFFTKQGMTMRRNIGSNFKIPPAALQSAITVSVILLMPLYETCFMPIARIIMRNEKGISVMQRMGIGMFLSIIAMVIAALTERKRLELAKNMAVSETIPMSIFWLLPQYILLGISDIFTVVGMQEFFFSEVPQSMKTLGIALYTSVFGVGSFVSALLITVLEYFTISSRGKSWFSDDMRESRLDNYYWLLAISSTVSLLLFLMFSAFYKSRNETAS